jgi:pimeloyl-ACP methyl ester carboxylesterase
VARSSPVDGFRLAYEGDRSGPPVVLLHGWRCVRFDYRGVMPLPSASADVVVPDLRGFGGSDEHAENPARAYSAEAQARSATGLLAELGLRSALIAGYDIGSRVAQTIARTSPEVLVASVPSA